MIKDMNAGMLLRLRELRRILSLSRTYDDIRQACEKSSGGMCMISHSVSEKAVLTNGNGAKQSVNRRTFS